MLLGPIHIGFRSYKMLKLIKKDMNTNIKTLKPFRGTKISMEIEIEGDLIITDPLSNESKDIKLSKTYIDWKNNDLNYYLQVEQYKIIYNTNHWGINKVFNCGDNHLMNTLLSELFDNEPTEEMVPNEVFKNHWIKKRHTWQTCNHSFYVYDYWLDVPTNKLVKASFTDYYEPTLTGYFLRGAS